MKIAKPPENPAPKHLSKRSKAFWQAIHARFVLEDHDVERLRIACEQVDLIDTCEAAIKRDGAFTADRYGGKRAHPAINVARDARQLLLRALRELCIDVEDPTEQRLPRQSRRYA